MEMYIQPMKMHQNRKQYTYIRTYVYVYVHTYIRIRIRTYVRTYDGFKA